MSMKKAGLLTIAIVLLAIAGILAYQYRKKETKAPVREQQGTLVREYKDGRDTICKD